jgi:hypothetical protein
MSPLRHFFLVSAVALPAVLFASCQQSQSRFTAGSQANLIGETTEPAGGRTKPAYEGIGMPEGIARAKGRYYYVRNGEGTILSSRQRFVQGATFDPGGRIMLADGSLVKLTEGDMVTFGGDRMPMPPGTRLP